MKKFLFALAAVLFFLSPVTAQAAPPSYGSTDGAKAAAQARLLQVRQTVEALQPVVLEAAVRTAGHNVRVYNYSDTDPLGLIYASEGSGVIVAMDGNMVYIVTAAHCLRRAHTQVQFSDNTVQEAYVAYVNSDKDVGFLLVPCAQLSEQTLQSLLPAAGSDAADIGKQKGDILFAVSSAAGPNALVEAGVLDDDSVAYPNQPSQQVLQFLSTVSYGSSGGGVYSLEGVWVGMVSGGDTYGICWAVPYGDIMTEFQSWLAALAQQQAGQQ